MRIYTPELTTVLTQLYPEYAEVSERLLQTTAEMCERDILPHAATVDKDHAFPALQIQTAFSHGLGAYHFPQEYGGTDLPYAFFLANTCELLGKACANTALTLMIHTAVASGLLSHGTEEQKTAYLPSLLTGATLGAFALTEPSGGSDAKNMRTKAEKTEQGYRLTGSKTFIRNAGEAHLYLVFSRLEEGHGAFLVEKDTPGFEVQDLGSKLGFRGTKTGTLYFTDCDIPEENLVSLQGFEVAKDILNGGRLAIAALCVGITQAAYEKARDYSLTREVGGRPIAELYAIQEKLAAMAMSLTSSRLLVYHAARLRDDGQPYALAANKAKVVASEMALRHCDQAIQIFGGAGYLDKEDVHRHWRDARLLTIGEGTSEVLIPLIARLEQKS